MFGLNDNTKVKADFGFLSLNLANSAKNLGVIFDCKFK